MRHLLLVAVLFISSVTGATAGRVWLGHARLFTNDVIGDGHDRWRTGAYVVSRIRGTGWSGRLPSRLGQLIEYRVRSEIIAPANLQNPVLGTDRPYVGALSIGAISHMRAGGNDLALGLDMVFTGPQTGLGHFQSVLHQAVGMGSVKVLGSQIGNAVYPTLGMELARNVEIPSRRRISVRPFLEAQAGVETFLRVGGDITIGRLGKGDFLVRDVTTGQRVTAIKSGDAPGVSFVLGGDVAYVWSSHYLPVSSGYTLQRPRVRLRAGIYHEASAGSIFYGLTWLGKEFVNQPTSQIVGSLTVRLKF